MCLLGSSPCSYPRTPHPLTPHPPHHPNTPTLSSRSASASIIFRFPCVPMAASRSLIVSLAAGLGTTRRRGSPVVGSLSMTLGGWGFGRIRMGNALGSGVAVDDAGVR